MYFLKHASSAIGCSSLAFSFHLVLQKKLCSIAGLEELLILCGIARLKIAHARPKLSADWGLCVVSADSSDHHISIWTYILSWLLQQI